MAAKMRPVFYALHAATMDPATRSGELVGRIRDADAFPDRRRASEGAVYTAALRRYRMMTGAEYRPTTTGASAATWGAESDHRGRVRSRLDGSYDARCSCGAAMVTFTEGDGWRWHVTHVGHVVGHVVGE